MLCVKIYCVLVIQCDLNYEGFCGIDEDLLEVVDICEFEKIEFYNVNNGECFFIYVICGKCGSGEILLNGVVVCLVYLGDLFIICIYVLMSDEEVVSYKFKVVFVDDKNCIISFKVI